MIRLLPTMPNFRYLHTCPDCGCHNVSTVRELAGLSNGRLKVCSFCHNVYKERRHYSPQLDHPRYWSQRPPGHRQYDHRNYSH